MTRATEEVSRPTTTVEALYDAFAPSLYRYAWSLLGGGPEFVADAVHDGLVAAVVLEAERTDDGDRGPWLYALVRSVCQRRGFAHTCPYTRLATVPAEAPVARMFSRLPASHRELVELNLRHVLPTSAVARVLGLDTQICGELSRSAIRRAADGLVDLSDTATAARETTDPSDAGAAGTAATVWRTQVQQVSSALALLRPPGPPPDLRERVVRTCTDPALADARVKIGAAMLPLTSEGYPLHRARVGGAVQADTTEARPSEPAAEQLPRALPADQVTTWDHPVRAETRTPLPDPDGAPYADEEEPGTTRRRWSLPAVSGLATVALAVGLWLWASAAEDATTIGPESIGPDRSPMATDADTANSASDGTSDMAEASAESQGDRSGQEGEGDESREPADQGSQDGADDGTGSGTGSGSPSDPESDDPPTDDPPEDEDQDESGGSSDGAEGEEPGTGLFDGLFGLFFGEG